MQDAAAAAMMQAAAPPFAAAPPGEEKEPVRCPRCDSGNTKFCYYNNYNLSQPRHFCKDCRRYWTKGGTLRNVPVGGGTRKASAKRPPAAAPAANHPSKRPSADSPKPITALPPDHSKPEAFSILYAPDDRMLEITGSFSSLLASSAGFGGLMDSFQFQPDVPGFATADLGRAVAGSELQSSNDSSGDLPAAAADTAQLENLLGLERESSCWADGWPDLAINTPGSGFQ